MREELRDEEEENAKCDKREKEERWKAEKDNKTFADNRISAKTNDWNFGDYSRTNKKSLLIYGWNG